MHGSCAGADYCLCHTAEAGQVRTGLVCMNVHGLVHVHVYGLVCNCVYGLVYMYVYGLVCGHFYGHKLKLKLNVIPGRNSNFFHHAPNR